MGWMNGLDVCRAVRARQAAGRGGADNAPLRGLPDRFVRLFLPLLPGGPAPAPPPPPPSPWPPTAPLHRDPTGRPPPAALGAAAAVQRLCGARLRRARAMEERRYHGLWLHAGVGPGADPVVRPAAGGDAPRIRESAALLARGLGAATGAAVAIGRTGGAHSFCRPAGRHA